MVDLVSQGGPPDPNLRRRTWPRDPQGAPPAGRGRCVASGRLSDAHPTPVSRRSTRNRASDALRVTLGRTYLESGQADLAKSTLPGGLRAGFRSTTLAGKLLAEAQKETGDQARRGKRPCLALLQDLPRATGRSRRFSNRSARLRPAPPPPAAAGTDDGRPSPRRGVAAPAHARRGRRLQRGPAAVPSRSSIPCRTTSPDDVAGGAPETDAAPPGGAGGPRPAPGRRSPPRRAPIASPAPPAAPIASAPVVAAARSSPWRRRRPARDRAADQYASPSCT